MAILIRVGYVMDGAATTQLAGFVAASTRQGVTAGTKAATASVSSTFQQFWGRALNIGMGIFVANAARTLGQAFTKIFSAPIAAGADLQKSLSKLSTLFPEAARSGEEFASQLLAMDKRLGSTAELSEGLFVVIQSGVRDAAEAFKILEASATLATTGYIDQATAAKAVTGLMLAYADSGLTAADAATQLFQGFTLAKTGFAEFVRGIGPILPQMKLAGVELKDMIATFILLTRQGVPAAQAFTFIKNALLKLIKPTKDAAKNFAILFDEFGGIGEHNIKEVIAEFGGFGKFLIEVGERAKAADIPITSLFTRLRAMPLPLTLAGDGVNGLAQAYKDLDAVVFDMNVQLDKGTTNLGKQWDTLKNNITDIISGPSLSGVKSLTDLLVKMNGVLSDPQARESIGLMVGALSTLIAKIAELAAVMGGGTIAAMVLLFRDLKEVGGDVKEFIANFGNPYGGVPTKPDFVTTQLRQAGMTDDFVGNQIAQWMTTLGTGPTEPDAGPSFMDMLSANTMGPSALLAPRPKRPVPLTESELKKLKEEQEERRREIMYTGRVQAQILENQVQDERNALMERERNRALILESIVRTEVENAATIEKITNESLDRMSKSTDAWANSTAENFLRVVRLAADVREQWRGPFEQVRDQMNKFKENLDELAKNKMPGFKTALGKVGAEIIKFATGASQIVSSLESVGVAVPKVVSGLVNAAFSIGEGFAQIATGNLVSGLISIGTGIVGAIGSLFGGPSKAAKQMQKQITETFGEISIELAEQIVKVSQAGEGWKRLGLILKEVEVNADNVVAVTDLTNHVFRQVAEGTVEASAAMADLQTAVIEIGPHFQALLEQAPAAFRELVKNIREAGLETEDFKNFAAGLAEAFLPDLSKALEGAMGPGSFEFFAATGAAALESLIAGGMSVVEAFRMMGDELTRLGELQQQYPDRAPGLELITSLNTFIQENPRMMDRLQALGSGMEFLANVGRVTADSFANWQNQLVNMANAMERQGASQEQILVMMGPQLGLARELAATYRYNLNPGVQGLINEGDRLGISMQRQRPIMEQIRDLLQQLVNATLGFSNATGAAANNIGRMANTTYTAQRNANQLASSLGAISIQGRNIGSIVGRFFQGGGLVTAQGGLTVPAMLHPGETVYTADATQRRGRQNIQAVGGGGGAPIIIEIVMPDGRKQLELNLEDLTRSGKTRIDLNSLPVEVG